MTDHAVAAARIAPYHPRPMRFIRRQTLAGWSLKVYGIALQGRAPRPQLVEATVALAAEALPQPAQADDRYGTGFVIAHDAATACIGIVYWWQSQNELHQRSFAGPLDAPEAMTRIEHPAAGCVWEMGIIDFERRMWLADVLANPAGPDFDRYLSRALDTEV